MAFNQRSTSLAAAIRRARGTAVAILFGGDYDHLGLDVVVESNNHISYEMTAKLENGLYTDILK